MLSWKICKFLELLWSLENKLFFLADPAEEFDEDPEGWGGLSSEVGGEAVTAEEDGIGTWGRQLGPEGSSWSE